MSHQLVNAWPWSQLYHRLGYSCIPLLPGSKRPAIKWRALQDNDTRLSGKERWHWFQNTGHNIGILTNSLVVADCDSPVFLKEIQSLCGNTPLVCRTPKGFHLYYRARKGVKLRNQVRVKGMALDLRTTGGYAVAPPSRNQDGVLYHWMGEVIPPSRLPVFKVRGLRIRRSVTTAWNSFPTPGEPEIRRARAYLARVEGAISGQRGHSRTFRTACILAQRFHLTFVLAWPLFLEWNQTCEPPWTENELRHKLEDAIRLTCRGE